MQRSPRAGAKAHSPVYGYNMFSTFKIIQVTMYTIWELIQPPAHAPVLQSICESEQKLTTSFIIFYITT